MDSQVTMAFKTRNLSSLRLLKFCMIWGYLQISSQCQWDHPCPGSICLRLSVPIRFPAAHPRQPQAAAPLLLRNVNVVSETETCAETNRVDHENNTCRCFKCNQTDTVPTRMGIEQSKSEKVFVLLQTLNPEIRFKEPKYIPLFYRKQKTRKTTSNNYSLTVHVFYLVLDASYINHVSNFSNPGTGHSSAKHKWR